MKTKSNKMMAAAVAMMVLAVGCGMPDEEQDEFGTNNNELGVKQMYAKAKPIGKIQVLPAPIYSLKTTDVKVAGQIPVNETSLLIATTIDLHVAIDYQYVTGAHTQLVQFFSPDGSFYQGFNRDICIGSGCTANLPEVIGTVAQYWESLPVAGSYISQYNLTGNWRVDLYVDGVKKASTGVLLQ